jgi:hypothetical protein
LRPRGVRPVVPVELLAALPRVDVARVVRVVFFSAAAEAAVSDLRARVVRFGAASAVLVAAEARFGAAAFAPSDLLAAALRGVAAFVAAGRLDEVFFSADFVSVAVFRAAVRFGFAGAASADAPADALLRVDVRRAGFASPALADFVVARAAIACARRLAGVSSVMCSILLCVF